MTNIPSTQATDGNPTYLGKGDPAGRFADYYPAWVDKMADDITLEGSMLDGAVQGSAAVRAIIGGVRQRYDRQDFRFAGPWGDNGFIEDYTAEVRGKPLGCFHLITFNDDGAAEHIAAHYRPLSSLMFFSRLLRENLAGTPYAERLSRGRGLSGHVREVDSHRRVHGGSQQRGQRRERDRRCSSRAQGLPRGG